MLAQAYTAKENKPAAIAELDELREGRRPQSRLDQAARQTPGRGRKQEGSRRRPRAPELHLPDGSRISIRSLGTLWFDQGNAKGAIQEFGAVAAYKPIDPARAHYDLARAYHLNHQDRAGQRRITVGFGSRPGLPAGPKTLAGAE